MLHAFADWVNRKSAFVLAFMLLSIGLVAGLTRAVAHLHDASGPSHQRGASGGACGEVTAWFNPATTVASLQAFLLQYGGTIVDGPDENDAYHLHFPDLPLRDALTASAQAPVVMRSNVNRTCESSAEGAAASANAADNPGTAHS